MDTDQPTGEANEEGAVGGEQGAEGGAVGGTPVGTGGRQPKEFAERRRVERAKEQISGTSLTICG